MMQKNRFFMLYLIWGVALAALYLYSIYITVHYNREIVKEASRAFFSEIVTTRTWNATHDGVYLIVSDRVQPNPYLEDSLRDLTTTGGIILTKVNPAYMTRQISEIARNKNGILYHITSLNPIRPANKPDEWEYTALLAFEKGVPEQFEMVDRDTTQMFRYMAPLLVEQSCLRCHAKQGYTLGQIRGGISITTRSEGFFSAVQRQIIIRSVIYSILLILGFAGIFFFHRKIRLQFTTIQELNSELVRNNQGKDRMFSILAHDLRSPLSGIAGLAKIMEDEGRALPPEELSRIAGSIYKSSISAISLSNHLVQWYMARKGSIRVMPEQFMLQGVAEEVIDMYREAAREKEISLTLDIPAALSVYADINMTETIFRNLLSNALKYTHRGGSVVIAATDSSTPGFAEISIQDNGIGMEEQMAESLFQQDITISRDGTEKESGSGLGISICRDFIHAQGGMIRVESTPGKGSRFVFTLPKNPFKTRDSNSLSEFPEFQ